MSILKAQELRKQRAKLVADARKLVNDAGEAGLNTEQEQTFDRMMEDADKLEREYLRLEKLADAEKDISTSQGTAAAQSEGTGENRGGAPDVSTQRRSAFDSYLRRGFGGLTEEERGILQNMRSNLSREERAMVVGTDASGGYTVPDEFYKKLTEAKKPFSGVEAAGATILNTSTGAPLAMPTENDTTNKGAIISEGGDRSSGSDPTFSQVILNAYMYTSKIVLVSLELLQDSAFDIEAYLTRKLGTRLARITNEHFTTGTGSSQPKGFIVGATLGVTGGTGQQETITYSNLVDLEHSVNAAYRVFGKWMMADSTVKAIKKMVDGQSRPLWVPGIAVREPDTILGYPWKVNDDMAAMAAEAKSVAFGDFSAYHIRRVAGVKIIRLVERYAELGQVGFLAFERTDGDMLDAGTHPIKYYQHPAAA